VSEAFVRQPGEGRELHIFGAALTLKATSGETGQAAYSLVEGVFQPGGFHPLAHIHTDREELFYVLEGEFDFLVAESTVRGAAGAFLHVPRGTLHQFQNAGNTPARLLFLHSPGLEGFFLELSALAQDGPPNPEALSALMREWAMEVMVP
jgi:quercetin dioxygenase-like cupin family protein